MLNANMDMVKKSVERKKHLWVVNIFKESVEATIIIECIFDFEVNFIINKLLVSAPVVKKQLTKAIFKDKDVKFYVNAFSLSKAFKTIIYYSWYFIKSLKVKICLKNGTKVIILLDTGVEINIIIRELIEKANLVTR